MGGGSTDASFPLVAKTLFGLEEVLAAELEEIGAGEITILTRAVQFTGNTELMYRSNLALRTATRILKQIAVFSAPDSDSLYTGVASVDWSEHLDTNSTFAVDPIISHSAFDNSLFVAQRAKDAIVDQMRDRRSRRPSVNRENPDIRLSLYIHKNEATLSLDSSGAPLHKRGYRLDYGAAPLNEVLAAGIIKLTGWSCEVPLLDPMCGSGTLLIEAALQTAGIPPGLLRKDYGFMRWKDYDRRLFSSVREELGARRVKSPLVKIIGSDMDKSCIRQARSNAEQAGIAELIHFEKARFEDRTPPRGYGGTGKSSGSGGAGVLIMNPPYGERLPVQEIEALYSSIGDTLKQKYAGYEAFILTGNLKAAKRFGIRSSARTKLYNGALECRLLHFEMYAGSRKPARSGHSGAAHAT